MKNTWRTEDKSIISKSCSEALLARDREADLWTEEKEPLERKRVMPLERLDSGKNQLLKGKEGHGNSLKEGKASDVKEGVSKGLQLDPGFDLLEKVMTEVCFFK